MLNLDAHLDGHRRVRPPPSKPSSMSNSSTSYPGSGHHPPGRLHGQCRRELRSRHHSRRAGEATATATDNCDDDVDIAITYSMASPPACVTANTASPGRGRPMPWTTVTTRHDQLRSADYCGGQTPPWTRRRRPHRRVRRRRKRRPLGMARRQRRSRGDNCVTSPGPTVMPPERLVRRDGCRDGDLHGHGRLWQQHETTATFTIEDTTAPAFSAMSRSTFPAMSGTAMQTSSKPWASSRSTRPAVHTLEASCVSFSEVATDRRLPGQLHRHRRVRKHEHLQPNRHPE